MLNVPRLYENTDLRASYVVWQEGGNPFVVVELLSPGTEKEDLGEQSASDLEQHPEALPSTGTTTSSRPILDNESATKAMPPSKEQGNWSLTDTEQERQLRSQAETQLRQVAVNLLQSGMSMEQVAQMTGLSEAQVRHLARPSVS